MNTGTRVAIVLAITLILVLVGGGVLFYSQRKNNLDDNKLIAEVSKIIELPTDETPQVATITDIDKLRNQPVFAKAKNGDKVLIYSLAKKAIIYDPKLHKIIDVAPVSVGSQSATEASTSAAPN